MSDPTDEEARAVLQEAGAFVHSLAPVVNALAAETSPRVVLLALTTMTIQAHKAYTPGLSRAELLSIVAGHFDLVNVLFTADDDGAAAAIQNIGDNVEETVAAWRTAVDAGKLERTAENAREAAEDLGWRNDQ